MRWAQHLASMARLVPDVSNRALAKARLVPDVSNRRFKSTFGDLAGRHFPQLRS